MAAPALIIISSEMLDRKKKLLNLPQRFPFDIDRLVHAIQAEIIWDKKETILHISDYSRLPRTFDEWIDSNKRWCAYWDISEGHLKRATNITQISARLVSDWSTNPYVYKPFLHPKVFAAYLRFGGHKNPIKKFKKFKDSYVPTEPIRFHSL